MAQPNPKNQPEKQGRIRWYVTVRWIFLWSVGLSGIIPEYFDLGPGTQWYKDILILLVGLAYNGIYWLLARRKTGKPGYWNSLGVIQVVSDIVLISYLIFGHGGIESRSIVLYAIPILLSGVLFGRAAIYLTAGLAAVVYDLIIVLDFINLAPSLNQTYPSWHHNGPYLATSILFYSAALLIIALITDFIIQRLRQQALRLKTQTDALVTAQSIAHLGSWDWDPKNNIVTWSDELYRIFAVSPEKFKGTFEGYLQLVHPDDRERIRGIVQHALAVKQGFSFEHRAILPDGSIRHISSKGSIQLTDSGEVVRLFGTALDITERKVAELELRERSTELERLNRLMVGREVKMAELKKRLTGAGMPDLDLAAAPSGGDPVKLLRDTKTAILNIMEDLQEEKQRIEQEVAKDDALLQSIGEGLIVIDEKGTIVGVNPVATRTLGYSEQELIGQWFPKALPAVKENGQPIDPLDRPINQALETGQPISAVVYYVKKDKTLFPASTTVAPFLLEGKPAGAIEVFRDVTAEKELERAKDEFISLASHQLKTPATGVKAYVSILLDGYGGDLTAKQKDFLSQILESNERQIKIVNDLLHVARAKAGRMVLVKKPIDLKVLIKSLASEQGPQIAERRQTLNMDLPDQPLVVNADTDRMQMVFDNLLSNASKYTPNGGKLGISLRPLAGGVEVDFSDTGVGIDQKDMSKLFQQFSRLDNPMSVQVGGTGLGLYLAKKIVDLHGGQLAVRSQPGQGSTFTVRLPSGDKTPGVAVERR